jgi:hypothetical protein
MPKGILFDAARFFQSTGPFASEGRQGGNRSYNLVAFFI